MINSSVLILNFTDMKFKNSAKYLLTFTVRLTLKVYKCYSKRQIDLDN